MGERGGVRVSVSFRGGGSRRLAIFGFFGPLRAPFEIWIRRGNRACVGAYLDDAAVGNEAGGACSRFVGAWTMRQRGFSGGGEARISGTRASPAVEVQTREEVESVARAGKQKK